MVMFDKPKKDEETIFNAAIEIDTPAKRAAFIKSACGDDTALLARVEALLKVHFEDGRFLKSPPGVDVTLDAGPLTERPGTKIGRYKLLQLIGEGGFGVVYMAEQEEPIRRKVALKIIKLGMDTKQVVARFEAERQALALMDHPNIARVFDAGATDTGRPYFVMELVKGIPITEYCDKNNLDTNKRLELFIGVCKAVQHAHQKGIIHRDIKPSNVMITLHDGRPVAKIIDFGIAKATQHRLTEKTLFTEYRQFIGTPEYMSPEQAEMSGLDIDTRSDIYSLGVLLYEQLTGTTPFAREQLLNVPYDEMRRVILETDPPKPSTRLSTLGEAITDIARHRHAQPSELRRIIRGDLDWIVMKSLEKDRTRRYETASELAVDVKRHLEDEMVLAGPPSAGYRLRKWAKRHKTPCLTVMLMLLFLIVFGTAMVTRRHLRLSRLNRVAERGLADAKLAIAQQDYSGAQRELTYVKAQLAGTPSLMTRYERELQELLLRAESELRLYRYNSLADEARFSAQPLLGILPEYWGWTDQELAEQLTEASRRCREALSIFNVINNPDWLEDPKQPSLDAGQVESVKRSAAELLFLLAETEYQLSKLSGDPVAGAQRAIELLNQVELLAPNLRSLYEYRSRHWGVLGNYEAASADARRAEGIQPVSWVDHCLLALKLWDQFENDKALEHVEAALALEADEYWSWYTWGLLQEWVIGKGQEARDRCRWAMSICINLRPQEALAWIARGSQGRESGERGREIALANIAKGLELTTEKDKGLRGLAYYARSIIYEERGQLDKALDEIGKAIETRPMETETWLVRYEWCRKAGRQDELCSETPRVFELFSEPKGNLQHYVRLEALEACEQWEEMVRECLEVESKKFAMNIFPRGSYGRLGLACAKLGKDYLTSGRFDKELEPYEQSKKINATDIKATVARVLVIGPEFRDPKVALPYALQAVNARPDWPYYSQTLGIIYYRLGRYEKAIETFQKTLEMYWDPNPAWEFFFMAMAQWRLGDKALARNLYYQGVENMARANLNDYFRNELLPFQYEAAELIGIPGAPEPNPDLVYHKEGE
jgi:tetratricopeptide (TPR) repeat protein